jgi:hypothetical protein
MKNTNNSVKKHQSYWVLLLALLFSTSLHAKINSYMGGYLQAGEWTLMPSGSQYGPSIGGVGGLGLLYELQSGNKTSPARFLFDVGLGAQGGLTSFMQSSDQRSVLTNQIDLDGMNFDYVYDVKNRHDQYINVAAQLPLMVGFQIHKFYMLAGVKVYANVWTKTNSSATITTFGRYVDQAGEKVFDDFYSMPEYQFFDNKPVSSGVRTALKLDVDASIEIGGRLGFLTDAVGFDVPKRFSEIRIAGFVDYGLFDIHTDRNLSALGTLNPSNPTQVLPLEGNLRYNDGVTYPVYGKTSMIDHVVLNDIMGTTNFASVVKNVVVGIKFTFLFQLREQNKCIYCIDAYGTSPSAGGGGGVQYEE